MLFLIDIVLLIVTLNICSSLEKSHLLFNHLNISLEGPSSKTISNIGGLQHLLGLHEYGFAAVARDSVQSLPECDATNKFGASFETTCGRRLVMESHHSFSYQLLLSLSLLCSLKGKKKSLSSF